MKRWKTIKQKKKIKGLLYERFKNNLRNPLVFLSANIYKYQTIQLENSFESLCNAEGFTTLNLQGQVVACILFFTYLCIVL